MQQNKTNDLAESDAERRLVARIQNRERGWEQLFDQLLAPHVPAVHARCQAYLRNAEDAADATQETLFRAFRAIDRFRGDAALRTWLFAIADNQCHTLARKRARYRLDPDLEPHLAQTLETADVARPQAEADLVQWGMSQIAPGGRDVLQLRYFADLPINEVATRLGIGLSAAKMRLYRAQEQLAGMIRPTLLDEAA